MDRDTTSRTNRTVLGLKRAFILTNEQLGSLPSAEQRFFRPVASSKTISHGQIARQLHIFYPYEETGISLPTEESVARYAPRYYELFLTPNREQLQGRAGAPEWWTLTRPRRWQHRRTPKLVGKAFGATRNFAYDETGEFVVVQGNALVWKGKSLVPYADSLLPFAYLALLNSSVLEAILACLCPRLTGGYFEFTPKFISQAFVPNLGDESRIAGDDIRDLASFGEEMHHGRPVESSLLNAVAARLYGIRSTDVP
jgi:hypothetical protein